jgi:hypothetical protein
MADVVTSFSAKDEGFAATMQRLQNRLTGFTKSMNTVGTASVQLKTNFGGLTQSVLGMATAYLGVSQAIGAFSKALDLSGRMADLSQITGESAGTLAVLERAFNNTDIGGEKMLPMLSKMSEFIQQLGNNSDAAVATAKTLGVTFDQLKNQTPIQQFQTLLRAVANLGTENERLTASGDVFGNRLGGKLIPLANNFTGEIANARSELGSLVGILDKNAASLEALGDKITNSIGNKLTELAVGFLSGVQGANELADSLSKIDAAGAGIKLGNIFSGALKEPMTAFLAMGEVLLLGVLKAGNALINATMHAARVYADALTSRELWQGVGDLLMGALAGLANFLTRTLLSAIKTAVIEPLAKLPSWLGGDIYKGLLSGFESVQGFFDDIGNESAKNITDGVGKIGSALSQSMQSVEKQSQDFLGAASQMKEVSAVLGRLSDRGTEGKPGQTTGTNAQADAKQNVLNEQQATAQRQANETNLRKSYEEQAKRLREANISTESFVKRMNALNRWFNQEMQGNTAPSLPNAQMQDSQMAESERANAKRNALSSASATSSENKLATETTLEKAVRFLEELTGKLPSPVLV